MPVFDEENDKVIGILHTKDYLIKRGNTGL